MTGELVDKRPAVQLPDSKERSSITDSVACSSSTGKLPLWVL